MKVFVEVDEEGTEAAAATAVIMTLRCVLMPPQLEFDLRCDRPFAMVIVDANTRAALFQGVIYDPSA